MFLKLKVHFFPHKRANNTWWEQAIVVKGPPKVVVKGPQLVVVKRDHKVVLMLKKNKKMG